MQPAKSKNIQLEMWQDLSQELTGLQVVSIAAGPLNDLYVLAARPPIDYQEIVSGAGFPKVNPVHDQDFAVLQVSDTKTTRIEIVRQRWNYHQVQPLPDGEILLVCARSRYRGQDDYDLNARVFSSDGKLKREFLLGDGIRDVQATHAGQLWVSYFDEGVFGNYGWKEPIGASGLVQWDKFGNRLYEFSPSFEWGTICDCYALNVVSNAETWCYYYTEFPLVQIRNGRITAVWRGSISGSDGFLVWRDFVLFRGGYDDHDLYHLVRLGKNDQMESVATYRLTDNEDTLLTPEQIATRGCFLYLLQEASCYRLDLREIISGEHSR
ncbi:hypothetical protein TFLX_03832 [Thermoflexales bacterium]|nr:hypothetical protein TFLX_03832 [Thermoflexales bacterium]